MDDTTNEPADHDIVTESVDQQQDGPPQDGPPQDGPPQDGPPQDGAMRLKTLVVRIGWVISAIGLVITMVGTGQLAAQGRMAGGGARAVHSTGLLILLLGFAVALVGYRLPWLIAISRTPQARDASNATRDNSHGSSSSAAGMHGLQLTLAFAVFLVLALFPFSVGIILLTPHFFAGLYIATVTFALATAVVVVIASGTPLQRAFCIGAAIPLLLAVCNFSIYGFSSIGPWSRRGVSSYSDDLWGSIEFQFEAAVEALAVFGAGMRLSIWFIWFSALVLGCAALGARMLLRYVNHEQR